MSQEPAEAPAITTAIVVAAREGAQARLRALCEVMGELGITVAVVESAEDAAAQMLIGAPDEPILVLIEASLGEPGEDGAAHEDQVIGGIMATIAGLASTLPNAAPVVAAPNPSRRLVIESFRAGAADFIDLSGETRESLGYLIARLGDRMARKNAERQRIHRLRGMLEEFLRDLIKTERRSIDLEHQLERKDRTGEATSDLDSDREPVVIIVEDDREVADMLVEELEEAGLATYAYVTGEDAVTGVRRLVARGDAIDLALVDAILPGMSGLEAIASMREHRPRLAAIMMTGHNDKDLAQHAADLGVVGYVLKPFDDIAGLVGRIVEQARLYRDQARDRTYLDRIKERHDKVLTQYRKVTADLDSIG